MSYKKNQRKNYQTPEAEAVDETVEVAEVAEHESADVNGEYQKNGVVDITSEYSGLNVRSCPDGEIVDVISNRTKVTIVSDIDDEYYKVVTESGTEGYCKKGYILVVED